MGVEKLIEIDSWKKVRIAVLGDAMEDVWVHGDPTSCQDGASASTREEWCAPRAGRPTPLVNWRAGMPKRCSSRPPVLRPAKPGTR